MRARYYNPATGRFISEDTHWNPSNMIYGDRSFEEDETKYPDITASLQAGNLYGYCMGNPVMYYDKTGNSATAIITIAGTLSLVDGPLPVGDIIAVALIAASAIYSSGVFIKDKNNNTVKLKSKDVDWNKSYDKNHIMHGSNGNHEPGWKKLNIDPNDQNSFNLMLKYLKDTIDDPDKITREYTKEGNLVIHFNKLYDDVVYVWTKIIQIGDTFRLSDGGAFVK